MIGTKLAHYEITSHLGSGGMGDVYQATDSKLGRSVAIKFLPEAFSHDSDRVARFQREARVLASLNHPNIAAIHGVEEVDTRHFLVMELVPGETLADRIKRGAIPIEEALPIAKQIVEALEEAHEKGIIHRDLKPANIKVTPDGRVKVLDFGLAKAYESEQANVALSNSPTMMSMAATNAGVILGTAAYMSPEQASGKTVDKRSDLWAFGVVLLEMLTGRAVFKGETVSHVLASVLKDEPDLSSLPSKTPAAIHRLLRRCLEKDRKQRFDSAADARLEIEEAMLAAPVAEVASTPRPGSNRLLWAAFLAAVLVAVGLAIPTLHHLRETSPPETRLDIVTPATTDTISFALSPDGRQIVFVASGDGQPRLWVRPLDAVGAQPLAGTEGARYPFWSPDSRSVGFFAGGKLKRIDIGGGRPQTLADAAPGFSGTWSSDGVILFAVTLSNTPLFRISASGGEAVAVTKLVKPSQTGHRFPQFLPGGRQFLFYVSGPEESQGIYLGSLDSSESKRLTAADSTGAFMSAGWLLFMRQGTLLARRFDPVRGELQGDSVTVADPVGLDSYGAGAFSVSASGLVAYRTGAVSRSQLIWFDRMGKTLGTFAAADDSNMQLPELSPDGRRVAARRTVQNNTDIYLLDSVGPTRFTFDAGLEQYAVWSPDGRWIAFSANRKSISDLYKKASSGAGGEELLLESPQTKNLDDWSPDGRSLLYNSEDPKSGRDLWVLPLDKDGKPGKPTEFLKTNFQEHRGQFSPDGRWVAYVSDQSGQPDIWVRQFPGPGGEWQVSTGGGIAPRWQPNGKELYYIATDGKLMAVPVTIRGEVFERATPVPLFQTHIAGGATNAYTRPQYDVSRDGRFLINTILDDAAATPITLLQNWQPPAK